MPSNHMILENEKGLRIQDPDEETIAAALAELSEGGFLILESAEGPFIQALREADGCFTVQSISGPDGAGHEASSVPVEQVVSVFRSYRRNDSSWFPVLSWSVLDGSSENDRPYWGLKVTSTPWPTVSNAGGPTGFVYLLRAGPFYKIGRTVDLDQRMTRINLQLPYPVELVHKIQAADPARAEHYWHKRFAGKRTNGEWFLLSEDEVTFFTSQACMQSSGLDCE